MQAQSLGQEDPLEAGMGTHSSILSSQQIPTQLGVDTTSAQESTLD